jgi:hypothetical protein
MLKLLSQSLVVPLERKNSNKKASVFVCGEFFSVIYKKKEPIEMIIRWLSKGLRG